MSDTRKRGTLLNSPVLQIDTIISGQAVIDNCCFCGQSHIHGFAEGVGSISDGYSKPMHKVSHCPVAEDYWLICTPETDNVRQTESGWIEDPE